MDPSDLVNGVPYSWLPAYGEAVESSQSNRNVLETILEETSDDEDGERWNHIGHSWNSDSDGQSVIEVDVNQDPETLSERDYICPAKRRRHDFDIGAGDGFSFRRPHSDGDRYRMDAAMFMDSTVEYFRRPEARFRFDEMCPELYSDSDSMSYNSLSRSSSLIQFESLERQFDAPPQSGSTPSLTDAALDSKLKDFLFNKKNTNISSNMIINETKTSSQSGPVHHNEQNSSSDSDTYSSVGSTSSSYSSEESYYLNQSDKTASLEEVKSVSPVQKTKARAKNSIESLSEDSGYCDQSSYNALRAKSKSNPNLLAAHSEVADDELGHKSMEDVSVSDRMTTTRQRQQRVGTLETKIALAPVRSAPKNNHYNLVEDGKVSESRESSVKPRVLSTSSPDLLIEHFYQSSQLAGKLTRKTLYQLYSKYLHRQSSQENDFCVVSSVPDDLNLCCDKGREENSHHAGDRFSWTTDSESYASKNVNLFTLKTDRLGEHQLPPPTPTQAHTHITTSYANLTLLNYSDENLYSSMSFDKQQANNRKYAAPELSVAEVDSQADFRSEFSSLLDEITAHFDRNLSILNDQDEDYDSYYNAFEEKSIRPPPRRSPVGVPPAPSASFDGHCSKAEPPRCPPQPPPRKSSKNRLIQPPSAPLSTFAVAAPSDPYLAINQSTLVPILESSSDECDRPEATSSPLTRTPAVQPPPLPPRKPFTFDQDPTNLVTCYAASLEKCDFDPSTVRIVIPKSTTATASRRQELVGKRGEFVCNSTPNLTSSPWSVYKGAQDDDFEHHNSLKDVTYSTNEKGILSTGSKGGLTKGVSFCPIVSEISWKETNIIEDDVKSMESEDMKEVEDEQDHEFDESDDDYADDCNDFGYLLPVQTHTFTTAMTMFNDDHESFRSDHHDLLHTYIEQSPMNVEIVNGDDTDAEADIDIDVPEDDGKVVNETYSNVQSSCKSYADPTTNRPTSSSTNSADIISDGVEAKTAARMNLQQSQNGVSSIGSKNQNNNVLVKQFEVRKNLINNNNQASNSIEYVKSDTISKVNLADSLNNEKSVTKDVQKIKKKEGFLSRIGLRFSFRGKKSSKNSLVSSPVPVVNEAVYNQLEEPKPENRKVVNKARQDIVFIPLKDPSKANVESFIRHEIEAAAGAPKEQSPVSSTASGEVNNHVLISTKPPLPKQPPRTTSAGGGRRPPKPPHAQRASLSPPPAVDCVDRAAAGSRHYHDIVPANQLRSTLRGGGPQAMGSEQKIGLIETNLDTHETVITGKTRSLMELGGPPNAHLLTRPATQYTRINGDCENAEQPGRPHKSMEFLLDKENHRNILTYRSQMPPENELQKSHDNKTNLSEHQLRVQASLQRLNVPDWYKNYGNNTAAKANESGLLRKRNSDVGRWTGLNSKTTSLSSLGSQRSDRSPIMLSPSAHSHHGNTGFSRWSTSHLNSNQTSPSVSTRGSFSRGVLTTGYQSAGNTLRGSYRQPYLGWRSQEKLSQPRTPAERLASSLMQQKQAAAAAADKPPRVPRPEHLSSATPTASRHPPVTPEIQSSIKEVTSAIVHYVNDQTSRNSRSRSTSPSQRCWLESSFVGTKPLESPKTPIFDTGNSFISASALSSSVQPQHHPIFSITGTNASSSVHRNSRQNGSVPTFSLPPERPTSATLDDIDVEDVLVNLLGLPASRPDDTTSQATDNKNKLQVESNSEQRRRSEGDTHKQKPPFEDPTAVHLRKLSLDSFEAKSVELVRCRYPKCDSSTTPAEAKKSYKSCHNCSHLYCSRECRRQHWEKHRKACLHSRVSALCRQVLSACKDDPDTLRHLSMLARRGFLAQGRGVIRILYRSPESADVFIKQGFQCLGEVTYVRWPDLMPAEMGPELYSELLRLSTEYKPESKMLLYVAICVVSEAPGSGQAPVKWERQLVSRCAKLKLCKSVISDMAHHQPAIANEPANDVVILTFNLSRKNSQKIREQVFQNVQAILRQRGISLRKHFAEVYQRLATFVEGSTDRFVPVTLHPRDVTTGRNFVCIIMAVTHESDIKIPSCENGAKVQVIDVTHQLTETPQAQPKD